MPSQLEKPLVVFDTSESFLGAAMGAFDCDLGCRPAAQGVLLAPYMVERDPFPPRIKSRAPEPTELPLTEKTEAGLPTNRERNHGSPSIRCGRERRSRCCG